MGFKVGDRVVFNGIVNMAAKKGATGEIIKIDDLYVYIKWDRNELSGEQSDGGYSLSYFKLCTPKIDYMQITKDMVGGR